VLLESGVHSLDYACAFFVDSILNEKGRGAKDRAGGGGRSDGGSPLPKDPRGRLWKRVWVRGYAGVESGAYRPAKTKERNRHRR